MKINVPYSGPVEIPNYTFSHENLEWIRNQLKSNDQELIVFIDDIEKAIAFHIYNKNERSTLLDKDKAKKYLLSLKSSINKLYWYYEQLRPQLFDFELMDLRSANPGLLWSGLKTLSEVIDNRLDKGPLSANDIQPKKISKFLLIRHVADAYIANLNAIPTTTKAGPFGSLLCLIFKCINEEFKNIEKSIALALEPFDELPDRLKFHVWVNANSLGLNSELFPKK